MTSCSVLDPSLLCGWKVGGILRGAMRARSGDTGSSALRDTGTEVLEAAAKQRGNPARSDPDRGPGISLLGQTTSRGSEIFTVPPAFIICHCCHNNPKVSGNASLLDQNTGVLQEPFLLVTIQTISHSANVYTGLGVKIIFKVAEVKDTQNPTRSS